MKTISIILAVLILGLSISPIFNVLCCSSSPSQSTQETTIHAHCSHHTQAENSSQESDNDGENEQNHDCNSFCACVCCNISIAVHYSPTTLTSIINHSEKPSPFFSFQYSFEYFPPIWQPPQIG